MVFSVNNIIIPITKRTIILKSLENKLNLLFLYEIVKITSENNIIMPKTKKVIIININPSIIIWILKERVSEKIKFEKNNAKNKKTFGFKRFIRIPFFKFFKKKFEAINLFPESNT